MKLAILIAAAALSLLSEGCTHQYTVTLEPGREQCLGAARTVYLAEAGVLGRLHPQRVLANTMQRMALPLRVVPSDREADLVLHYFDFQRICYDDCIDPPGWAWFAVLVTTDDQLVATFQGPLDLLNLSGVKTFAGALDKARRAQSNSTAPDCAGRPSNAIP